MPINLTVKALEEDHVVMEAGAQRAADIIDGLERDAAVDSSRNAQRPVIRIVFALISIPLLALGQQPQKSGLLTVPADRRPDTYAIYSAVLTRPSLSHADSNQQYLIRDYSGPMMEQDPTNCITPPEIYRSEFSEALADRVAQRAAMYQLERAFKIPKPYTLITEDQVKQFQALRGGPLSTTEGVKEFRGATDIILLGKVYFDRKRKLAVVYTWAWCGGLCACGSWRVFTKNGKGSWEEREWIGCMTIASSL